MLPLFHVGGAFCGSLPALGVGAAMVLPTAAGFRNPDVVANFWRIVEDQRVTIGGLVPTALGAAAEAPAQGCDLSRLRAVLRPARRSVRRRSKNGSCAPGRATACARSTA